MKIKFNQDVTLTVIVDVDEPEGEDFEFQKDTIEDAEIIDGGPPHDSQLQFGDGSVTFVPSDFWKLVSVLPQ